MIVLTGVIALPGIVLTGPFIMVLEYLAEIERKKALAGSKVKISGKDVVASYKIMISTVIFPLSSLIFTTAFFLFLFFYV
jgi:glycerol-3-phosphate O-acyltransferase / dihydroxyacetone phosphate acyltransferase